MNDYHYFILFINCKFNIAFPGVGDEDENAKAAETFLSFVCVKWNEHDDNTV